MWHACSYTYLSNSATRCRSVYDSFASRLRWMPRNVGETLISPLPVILVEPGSIWPARGIGNYGNAWWIDRFTYQCTQITDGGQMNVTGVYWSDLLWLMLGAFLIMWRAIFIRFDLTLSRGNFVEIWKLKSAAILVAFNMCLQQSQRETAEIVFHELQKYSVVSFGVCLVYKNAT